MNQYLAQDSYAPSSPKPSLQQYDNYQIYSIACIGDEFKKVLAFQIYNVNPIPVNFTNIAITYS